MAFISNIEVNEQEYGVRAVAIPTGTVDSTSTSKAFTATVPGIKELRDGICCFIKNGKVTSASGCTLNVNGLGAKPIYNSMAAASAVTTTFNTNYTMLFVYDSTRVSGGCWVMYYGYNSAGYTNNVSQGQGYATCSTAASTVAKTAALSSYALVAHGICSVLFTNGNTAANPTLNINSKGAKAIYYKGAACPADLIKAGDIVTMIYNTQYHIISIYNGNRGFATTTPVMDGTAAIGTSTEYARADHIHPTDTSRAPLESPAFTGTPTAPTPSDETSNQIATASWVKEAINGILDNFSTNLVLFFSEGNIYPFSPAIGQAFLIVQYGTNGLFTFSKLVSIYNSGIQTFTWGLFSSDPTSDEEIVETFPIFPSGGNMVNKFDFQGVYKTKLITLSVEAPENSSDTCYATITDIQELGVTAGAMHFKGSAQQTLTDGGTENAASSVIGSEYLGDAGDVYLQYNDTSEEYVWTGSIWEKLGRDDLPTASTTTAGIVQLGTGSTQAAQGNHIHGNITNSGAVTTTVTVASNDRILITDNSDSNKVKAGPIFNTASATYFLNAAGNWTTPTGDHQVTQAPINTSGSYPILFGAASTDTVTTTVYKNINLTFNPSSNELFVGNNAVTTQLELAVTSNPFTTATLSYTPAISWSTLEDAAYNCDNISLIINDGGYNRGRLNSYFLDNDAEKIYFNFNYQDEDTGLSYGQFEISQNGSTDNLKINWVPIANANTTSY